MFPENEDEPEEDAESSSRRDGTKVEFVLGFIVGYMFGLFAICFIFALRQGRTTRKKFKNGVYSGFILRTVLGLYMVNRQQQEQLAHYNKNFDPINYHFNQTSPASPGAPNLNNEKFLGLPNEGENHPPGSSSLPAER